MFLYVLYNILLDIVIFVFIILALKINENYISLKYCNDNI